MFKKIKEIKSSLMIGETIKSLVDDYGGAVKVASQMYNGLNRFETFKENKVFADINKAISVATIGFDMYNRVKRFRQNNQPYKRTFHDEQRDFIYPLIDSKGPHNYGCTNLYMSEGTLEWFFNNISDHEMVLGFYDMEDLKEITLNDIMDKHFTYQFCVLIESEDLKYLIEIERSTKKKLKITNLVYPENTTMTRIRNISAKIQYSHLQSMGIEKNIIRFDGTSPKCEPRSGPVDIELESIDIPKFKTEVAAVLDNNERRGILLAGNPGTGKSTVLLKLENELCDYPIVYTTAKNFGDEDDIQQFDNFIGVMDKCIVFIEDMDAMDLSVKSAKVRTLLELLDGVRRKNAVVFIATINDASLITESIVRTGRFDDVIEIHEPKQNHVIHSVLRFAWTKYNGSDEGFPCSPKDISWLTYWRLKRYKLSQSDYNAIVQKIHLMKDKINNKTLIEYTKDVVNSKEVIHKYTHKNKKNK